MARKQLKQSVYKKRDRIKPKVKICINCFKRKVRHHHVYCDKCWYKKNMNGGNKDEI